DKLVRGTDGESDETILVLRETKLGTDNTASLRGVLGVRFRVVAVNLCAVGEVRESSLNLLAWVASVACSEKRHSYLCLLVLRRVMVLSRSPDSILVQHGMPLVVAAILEFKKLSCVAGNLSICYDRERCFMIPSDKVLLSCMIDAF
ncbi:hypothetical protein Dimus_013338, partial [Dionaea muscipula]